MKKYTTTALQTDSISVKNLVQMQREFFETGETLDIRFRLKQLMRLRRSISDFEEQIVWALKQDLHKHEMEAYATEIGIVYSEIDLAIKSLSAWMKPEAVRTPLYLMPAKSRIHSEPYGVCLIVGPFNYPFQLIMSPLVGAIAAGNCVVLKPSNQASYTEQIIQSLIRRAFAPHYIACALGDPDLTSQLLSQPWDYIFFTGSSHTGRLVMEKAAEHLTPVTLELGGKSPVIVHKSANLQRAAQAIMWGKLLNSGQTCIAPDYLLVHEDVKDELMVELIFAAKDLYSQEPMSSASYGRIINKKHFDRIMNMLDQDAANVRYGGNSKVEELYIAPTILDANWDSATMKEEIFGPILPVIGFRDLPQVVKKIQEKDKPLALYIFAEDSSVIEYLTQRISAGGVCVNDTLSHIVNPNLPFGGVGPSGMGSYHGKYSFDTFSHKKSVLTRGKLLPTIAYPPYTKEKLALVRSILK